VIFAAGTFIVSSTLITPVYRSGFITYVNNKLEISNSGNTTVSDLNASYALAYTYESIITSRSVITESVELCKQNGTYPVGDGVAYRISTSVAEKAPIISVYVETPDADFARDLATAIAQVAPKHVERVVEGSSMRIVDEPIRPNSPSAPNNLQNALFGAVVGFLLACLAVIALEFYLDKVQSTEDLERRYDIPALGTIPDMDQAKRSSGRKVSVGR
jgi:capsular polysaccharide biosynthesis protein